MKITTKNLSYKNIIKSINITFNENSINYISGSNKCGKTTFIKLLSGLIETKESVFYGKKDLYNFSSYELSTQIGKVIYDDINNFIFKNVKDELLYVLDNLGIEKKEKNKRLKNIVNLFDLDLDTNICELSNIKKIELLLAIELLSKPQVIFLDDIFCDIQIKTAKEILLKLKSIDNLTIVIASNNLDLAVIADKLIILNKGEIILDDDATTSLTKDSLLNKAGLDLPFMIDLSTKLKYYNLLDDVELEMNRMVEKLWK